MGSGGIQNINKDIVEYINVERASCLGNGGIKNIIKVL